MSFEEQIILMIIGAGIGLISSLAGVLFNHWLCIRRKKKLMDLKARNMRADLTRGVAEFWSRKDDLRKHFAPTQKHERYSPVHKQTPHSFNALIILFLILIAIAGFAVARGLLSPWIIIGYAAGFTVAVILLRVIRDFVYRKV